MERVVFVSIPPLGRILDRYLIRGYMPTFAITLWCCTFVYLIVDFFDRVGNFVHAGTPLESVLRYFLCKLPLMVSHVIGIAALFSTLFFLGMLSRAHEITAMRISGLRLWRIFVPLLLLALLLAIFTFFWNETVVPVFTRKSRYIFRTEVDKIPPHILIGSKDIWLRGDGNFISVYDFDRKTNVLEGVSLYLLSRDLGLRGIIVAPWARWNGTRWEVRGGTEWLFLPNGQATHREVDTYLPLSETPEDFKPLALEPEEFSLSDLQKQIADHQRKGIVATRYEIDLQLKMALPLLSPLMVLLAIPFGLRYGQRGALALSFGPTIMIGLAYWFLLGFSVALGRSGALAPGLAAWLPNLVLALLGLFFFISEE